MASGITVIKGHGTGRPAKTPNPCFCMPSYNTAVFRPILLLVKLFLVHYSLEVFVVTYENLKRNVISYSDSLIHRSLCKLQIKSHAAIATCSSVWRRSRFIFSTLWRFLNHNNLVWFDSAAIVKFLN